MELVKYMDGQYKVNFGFNMSTISYTNTGLIAGTEYYYVVSALNNGVEGANSSEVNGTPPLTSLIPNMTSNTTPSGTVTSNGATGYNLTPTSDYAYRAFSTIGDISWWANENAWVQYDFGSSVTVSYYSGHIVDGGVSPSVVTAATIQCSTNGTDWTTIASYGAGGFSIDPPAMILFASAPITARYFRWNASITSAATDGTFFNLLHLY